MAATTQRTVTVWQDKVQARVMVAGSGPPLVYLHSGYGLVWDDFLDLMARDFTVYAPEHPGTSAGLPDAVKPLDDVWDLTLFYDELFERLGLQRPAVVGHSFGGMVAAELAASAGGCVGELVLIDSLGLWRDDTPIRNYMVMAQTDVEPLLFHDRTHPARKHIFANLEDADSIVRLTWALACTGKFIWPLSDKGLKKRIHRITAPTLIIWGRQDGLTPPVYAGEFARLIPNSRTEIIDRAAHMAPMEQPAAVAALVRDFIKR